MLIAVVSCAVGIPDETLVLGLELKAYLHDTGQGATAIKVVRHRCRNREESHIMVFELQ